MRSFPSVRLTYHAFSCERLHEPAAERHGGCRQLSNNAIRSRRDAVQVAMHQALQRRGYERPLVGCYAELDRGHMWRPVTVKVKDAKAKTIRGYLFWPP